MQIAAVVVEMVEVAPTAAVAQIAAAGKRADEEFR